MPGNNDKGRMEQQGARQYESGNQQIIDLNRELEEQREELKSLQDSVRKHSEQLSGNDDREMLENCVFTRLSAHEKKHEDYDRMVSRGFAFAVWFGSTVGGLVAIAIWKIITTGKL